MIKPKALTKGGTIGIVSPAGPVDPGELDRAVKRLTGMGFRVVLGDSVLERWRYLAGPDGARAADLNKMFRRPEVSAILCARGGFGTARLLDHLDEAAATANPKIVVGSSDVTLLLNHLHQRFGWITFHGPMAAPNFGRTPSALTEEWFTRILSGDLSRPVMAFEGTTALRGGVAEGRLAGGCLTLLCSSLGTPYEIRTEGSILLLEDVDEAPYRIDRMLVQLKAASKFRGVRGVLFGKMPGCHPPPEAGFRLEQAVSDILRDYDIPILFGFPAGHGGEQVTLPLGARVRLNAERAGLELLESGVES